MEETFVKGNDEDRFVCITSDTRPDPWHILVRAHDHLWKDVGWAFIDRYEVAKLLNRLSLEVAGKIPPQRSIKWGWGNDPYIGVDRRKDIKA